MTRTVRPRTLRRERLHPRGDGLRTAARRLRLVALLTAVPTLSITAQSAVSAPAGTPPAPADSIVAACASAAHRAFDFWIGHWDVSHADGKAAGENRITRVLGGCALHESWQGVDGSRGNSYTLFDLATGQWHQQWVDIGGNLLRLSGRVEEGAIVLEGRNIIPTGTAHSRISWSLLPDARVRQHWQLSTDGGVTWATHFDGYYRRRAAVTAPAR